MYIQKSGGTMNQDIREHNAETCNVSAIHEDIVTEVAQRMPNQERVQSLAALFKAFGDGTRLSILWALCESEMCVCDICALLNLKQSAVSHQLNKLKMSRVIKNRREGKVVFYSLADDHVRQILAMGMEHISE
jgi:ArsR family transcriptional regulator